MHRRRLGRTEHRFLLAAEHRQGHDRCAKPQISSRRSSHGGAVPVPLQLAGRAPPPLAPWDAELGRAGTCCPPHFERCKEAVRLPPLSPSAHLCEAGKGWHGPPVVLHVLRAARPVLAAGLPPLAHGFVQADCRPAAARSYEKRREQPCNRRLWLGGLVPVSCNHALGDQQWAGARPRTAEGAATKRICRSILSSVLDWFGADAECTADAVQLFTQLCSNLGIRSRSGFAQATGCAIERGHSTSRTAGELH